MLRVPTVTIPEILAAIDGDVDLLKFNVEGAEFDVLESMTTGDFARIKRITVQYHDQEASGALQPRTGARLQSLLEAHGYRCLRLPDARLLFAVHAEGTRV